MTSEFSLVPTHTRSCGITMANALGYQRNFCHRCGRDLLWTFLKLLGIGRCREACVLLYQLFRVNYKWNPRYNYLSIINMHCNLIQWHDRKKTATVLNNGPSTANLSSIRTGVWTNRCVWKRSRPSLHILYSSQRQYSIETAYSIRKNVKMCSRDEMSCMANLKNVRININGSNIDSIFHLDLMTGKQGLLHAIISVAPNTYKYITARNGTRRPIRFRCQHFLWRYQEAAWKWSSASRNLKHASDDIRILRNDKRIYYDVLILILLTCNGCSDSGSRCKERKTKFPPEFVSSWTSSELVLCGWSWFWLSFHRPLR